MVISGIRALIVRQISRVRRGSQAQARSRTGPTPTPHQGSTASPSRHPDLSVVQVAPSIMVYSYSPPFETGKLKVSDIHTLQSVIWPLALLACCLTRTLQLRGFGK